MSEDKNVRAEGDNYEAEKSAYEVGQTYLLPKSYLKYIWIWPTVVLYLFTIAVATPATRVYNAGVTLILVALIYVIGNFVHKRWPL